MERRVVTIGHGQRGRRPDRTHGRRDVRREHAAPRRQSRTCSAGTGMSRSWTAPGTATRIRPRPTPCSRANDDVEGWSGAFFGAEDVNGSNIPLLGMEPSSSVTPPIRYGRMVELRGEIVLGTGHAAAARRRHRGRRCRRLRARLRVVGSATLPTIGIVHGDHTSLGVGGIVVPEDVPGYDRNIAGTAIDLDERRADSPRCLRAQRALRSVPCRYRHQGRDRPAGDATPTRSATTTASRSRRSSDLPRSSTPTTSAICRHLLGSVVALSALASLGLALNAGVRRRRRELALLKALGFTRRQVTADHRVASDDHDHRRTADRRAPRRPPRPTPWNAFANQLDVVAEPAVPVIVISLVVLAALVAANLLAALPARSARAVAPSSAAFGVKRAGPPGAAAPMDCAQSCAESVTCKSMRRIGTDPRRPRSGRASHRSAAASRRCLHPHRPRVRSTRATGPHRSRRRTR